MHTVTTCMVFTDSVPVKLNQVKRDMLLSLSFRPSLHSSSLQAEAVRRVMSELNLTVVEMGAEEGDSGGATLEGSDVLFTGREFFVGISSHTNRRGAEVLADTFRVVMT